MEWSVDAEKKLPRCHNTSADPRCFPRSGAKPLHSFPKWLKMRIYFYTHPIHIKTIAFILYLPPPFIPLTLHPLNPPVTGYYHHSLIFGFVSNNMAPVNHVRLTTVTATTTLLWPTGMSTIR